MPQQTIIMLAQTLIDGLKDSEQRQTLQAIQYGTRLVQLQVQDLTDLQAIKYNKFSKNESNLDITKAIWEIVHINEVSV